MEFFVLDSNFQRKEVLDKFISGIWTERYIGSGDLNIVLEPTSENRALLPEGTRLMIEDSDEVMTIQNHLIEDGVLKVTGTTLDYILDDRVIYQTAYNVPKAYPVNNYPEAVILEIINKFIVNESEVFIRNRIDQVIPNFSVAGAIDNVVGTSITTISVPFGILRNAIRQIAETYNLGFKIYLYSSSPPATYAIRLKMWTGINRTSDQSVNEVVQFSPGLDNLTNVKSLKSIENYKNAAIVWASSLGQVEISLGDGSWVYNPTAVFSDGASSATNGFNLRAIYVEADDVVNQGGMGYYTTDARWREFRTTLEQRGKDALANNKYIKLIDGEVILDGRWVYGVDYGLGDFVELVDNDLKQKARITEYIRSQDQEGEKAYPTVSVI